MPKTIQHSAGVADTGIQAARIVLKELGGWASLTMVLRYAHLATEHLAEHADRISTQDKPNYLGVII